MSDPFNADPHRAIEWECEQLVRRFANLNDERDHERLAALFTDSASFARPFDPDNPIVGQKNIMILFRDRPLRLSRHFMTNTVIDVISPTRAQGRSYLLFFSSMDAEAPRPVKAEPEIHIGQYDDVFVLTPSGWRFQERRGSLVLAA